MTSISIFVLEAGHDFKVVEEVDKRIAGETLFHIEFYANTSCKLIRSSVSL